MSIRQTVLNAFAMKQNRLAPPALTGILGDEGGTVDIPDDPGYVWVQVGGGVVRAYNDAVATMPGLLVKVMDDPYMPGNYRIIGRMPVPAYPGEVMTGAVAHHGETHSLALDPAGDDPVWIDQRQYMPGRVTPGDGLAVAVYPFNIWTGTAWSLVLPTAQYSLTTFIPTTSGSGAFVILTVDAAAAVTLTKGTEKATASLTWSDIPAPPSGALYALGAVRVYNGQTEIYEGVNGSDIVDLRGTAWTQGNLIPSSVPFGTPISDISASASSAGTSGSAARSDHTHRHGDLTGGSLHATSTSAAAGFLRALSGNAGQFLDGSGDWATVSTSLALNDLTDVDTTGSAAGNVLYVNGSEWKVYALGLGINLANNGTKLILGNVSGLNYVDIDDSSGNLRLLGTAKSYKDEIGDALALKVKGARIADDTTELVLNFADNCVITDDWAGKNVQLNHDRDLSASIMPHIHWFQASANVPNWLLQYRWQINGGTKTTSWTSAKYSSIVFTYVSGTIHQIAAFAAITPPTGTNLSDIVQFRILRDVANGSGLFAGADPLVGNAALLMFDVHFVVDGFGSDTEYQKDAASSLMLEDGSYFLLETGDKLLLQ